METKDTTLYAALYWRQQLDDIDRLIAGVPDPFAKKETKPKLTLIQGGKNNGCV